MYAVIALFDAQTERMIKNIWKELKENSLSNYAYEVRDRLPHITLASYEKLDIEDFIEDMETYYKDKKSITITLQSLGSFLNTGILYLAPTVTTELLDFHTNHYHHFNNYNSEALYEPKKWIPHCTIGNRLSENKLKEAFYYCLKHLQPIPATIEQVAVIETIFENGKCIRAPIIFSAKLKSN